MKIKAYTEYVTGYLRRGHYECDIPEDKYLELKNDDAALHTYIEENAEFVLDSWSVEDCGPISYIKTE